MAIKSRFQRRMARQSRKQQGRRQLGSDKVPYSVFPSSYEPSAFSFINEQDEPTSSYQFRRNVENQTEGGPGTRGDGSFCSGMDQKNCNAASLACEWNTRSDTGSSFCKRRSYGAQQERVVGSLSVVEAGEEKRLREAREQYKADAELKRLFEAAPAPKRSRGRASATQSVPPPPPPPPGPYGSYVPPPMPTFRSAPPPAPPMPTFSMASRSASLPSSMPFLPTMGSRSVAPPVPFSPPAAPKKSRTAAKSPAKSEPEPEQINLYTMTMEQLTKIAAELGITVARTNKHADIIRKIEAKVAKMEAE
jgi:hypothetical protein